jgi:hypothetical protein
VSRRRSIEGKNSSEGANGGDAQMDSGAGEGLQRQKTSEEDTWAMGTNVWRSDVDGRDDDAWGERNFWPAGSSSILTGSDGVGARGWTPWGGGAGEREGGPSTAWSSAASVRRVRVVRCRTTVESGRVGATRSTWLTGGPGRDGGPVFSV